MTTALRNPDITMQPIDEVGTILVYETVPRVTRVGEKAVMRKRLWGVIIPVPGGLFQATDPDGNDVGDAQESLTLAVDILFEPVRSSSR